VGQGTGAEHFGYVSAKVFLPSYGTAVTEFLRQNCDECLDVMVTLFQQRGTCGSSGLSRVSFCIGKASEGDRGVPIDTGCRPQLTSCF
jgi:hypothetical protein